MLHKICNGIILLFNLYVHSFIIIIIIIENIVFRISTLQKPREFNLFAFYFRSAVPILSITSIVLNFVFSVNNFRLLEINCNIFKESNILFCIF